MLKLGKVLILGDSYSTFEGYIPEGNSIYYKYDCDWSDLSKVEQTWWHQLISDTDSDLILNESYSGSTVCTTGYEGKYVPETSFLGRLRRFIKNTLNKDNVPDTIIVFGGTNDSWAGSPLGEIQLSDWTEESEKSVLPAFCELMQIIKDIAPGARIINVMNTGLKEEIENGITEISRIYGADLVVLKCIDKHEGHPTILGMKQIKEQFIDQIS